MDIKNDAADVKADKAEQQHGSENTDLEADEADLRADRTSCQGDQNANTDSDHDTDHPGPGAPSATHGDDDDRSEKATRPDDARLESAKLVSANGGAALRSEIFGTAALLLIAIAVISGLASKRRPSH